MIFQVDGFWNDTKEKFENYLVCEHDCTPAGYLDEDIFWYGVNPKCVADDYGEFTITAYRVYDGG